MSTVSDDSNNCNLVHEAALAACQAGISVIPPKEDGSKAPDVPSWKQYQKTPASPAQIDIWYSKPRTGLGFVTGAVSKNLLPLDFDRLEAYFKFREVAEKFGESALIDFIAAGYFETTPKGAHILIKLEIAPPGSEKLASDRNGNTIIETRGEGGYIVVAPSNGTVNPNGAYKLESGGVDTIRTITADQFQVIKRRCSLLDESPKRYQK